MSELERQFEEMKRQVAALAREVSELRRGGAGSSSSFENLPDNAAVGKDYIAYRFGCSERAVLNDPKFKQLPRVSNCPLKFVKRDVDRLFEKSKKIPVAQRAADERKKAKKRIYSVVVKN